MTTGWHFYWPWVWLMLPIPLLAARLLPPAPSGSGGGLLAPFYAELAQFGLASHQTRVGRWLVLLAVLIWLLLVTAASRPEWVDQPQTAPVSGRDLMLAVDLSGSMEIPDYELNGHMVDRLQAIKAVAGAFIRRRTGDRLGLVLFGTRAYLQVPLTFDLTTVAKQLDESSIGLAGKETAIGDAIGLAVKHLLDRPGDSRVIILLTDGASNAGLLEPKQAANLAAQAKVKIHAIGIGSDKPIMIRTPFGPRPIQPAEELDEATLRELATISHGQYFRATDSDRLTEIYRLLDQLEPTLADGEQLLIRTELYDWPLGAALILSAAAALVLTGLPLARRRQPT